MYTEKDAEFVQYLLQGTQDHKLRWEYTAITDEFVCSLKGKYKVVLKKVGSIRYMKMIDTADHELVFITSDEYAPIWDLFENARRAAFDVDSAIDEILKD